MEKRAALFLSLALGILMLNVLINNAIRGPAPPGEPGQPGDAPAVPLAAEEGAGAPAAVEGAGAPPVEGAGEAAEVPDGVAGAEAPAAEERPVDGEPAEGAAADVTEEWITLGSVDPDAQQNPYRMLVTFTNRGAAIRRLEMSSPRFLELDDRTGYVGHLEPVVARGGGCRVRVVGAGTPAADAGLQPDDVITALNDTEIDDPDDLRRALEKTKPRQEVILQVRRGAGAPRPMSVKLRRQPLSVMRPEIDNLRLRDEEPPLDFVDPPSLLLTLDKLDGQTIDENEAELPGLQLHTDNWEVFERGPAHVAFRHRLPESGLEVIKRFRLAEVPAEQSEEATYPAYHLQFDIEIRNTGAAPRDVAYRLDGPTGLPVEGWWFANKISRNTGSAGLRDLVVWFEGQKAPWMYTAAAITDGKVKPMGHDNSMMYIGIDAQYFAAMLLPEKKELSDNWLDSAEAIRLAGEPDAATIKRHTNITCRLNSNTQTLAPGGAPFVQRFQFFAGPKKPELLTQYGQGPEKEYSLRELVYYGWFTVVAKLMIGVLHFFYSIVRNYGVAIILLTVVVRGCMFPLSRKQALNMVKMQELQPEMKRIAEKYKDNMEKRTKAQQDLFRNNNYNPMGGCLLMFFQLPIFLGLYRALMVDIELRQAPLLGDSIRWCSNLAAPDMLYNWSRFMPDSINSGQGIFGLGPYLNILPLVTVGLFVFQQKMFMPPPADEQAAMQQKVMSWMMLFIGILFYKVASGLCLYFIASSAWGMGERMFLPKAPPKGTEAEATPSRPPPRSSSNGSGGQSGKKKKKKQRKR